MKITTTPEETLLIIFSVITMLLIGGAFLGAMFYFNARLGNEQKSAEAQEKEQSGQAGGSGYKPDAPPPGRDFQPMSETPDSFDNR